MTTLRINAIVATLVTGLGAAATANAGAFIGVEQENPNFVTHPSGYNIGTGSPGQFTVNVCVVPGSVDAAQIEISVANIVDIMNGNVPVDRNLRTDPDFANPQPLDFESVALHELGHCLGLAHPNAASESGLSGAPANSTKARPGPDMGLDIDPGIDGLHGSPDDVRGDDVNVHLFVPMVNDPFQILRTVDSTNYTVDVSQLPPGDSFVANADRAVGDLSRYDPGNDRDPCRDLSGSNFFQPNDLCQEAVMQQGSGTLEYQRALAADDVAMFKYARSGLDRIAGTADDYEPTIAFLGISDSSSCDVNLSFNDGETGFAVCKSGPANINRSQNVIGLIQPNAFFNTNSNWRFSDVRIPLAAPDQATVSPGASTTPPVNLLANDSVQHTSGSLVASTEAFGGPENGTVSIDPSGSFTYTNTNPAATSDFFVYEVCMTVANSSGVPACNYQLVDLTIDGEADDLVFRNSFETTR